jgi:hypothetical protein
MHISTALSVFIGVPEAVARKVPDEQRTCV